jgi:ribulose-phosphate 3-epimerase
MSYKLGYSIIAGDLLRIEDTINDISFVDFIHVDIMDGNFVKNLTIGPQYVKDLKDKIPDRYLDCHLMVTDPDAYIDRLSFVDRITVHIEDSNVEESFKKIKKNDIDAGLAISPDTPIACIDRYMPLLRKNDIVQIMTVQPGKCGQSFIGSQLEKMKYIRRRYPNTIIQVDGGINAGNVSLCVDSGANNFVCGSSMMTDGKKINGLLKTIHNSAS